MNPKDDETSLGAILLELEIITPDQLRLALDRQENSTIEQLLGMVLVHMGFCSKDDVEAALSAQKSLRAGKKGDVTKALAAMDFAIHRKGSNGARQKAIEKGAAFYKQKTGQEFPAVTAALLAKGTPER